MGLGLMYSYGELKDFVDQLLADARCPGPGTGRSWGKETCIPRWSIIAEAPGRKGRGRDGIRGHRKIMPVLAHKVCKIFVLCS